MEEQIYQDVWCQVFALTCAQPLAAGLDDLAQKKADWAAKQAVLRWDESKRLAAITAKNKEGK